MRLVVIFGPPAVGKMTVGLQLVRLGGFRLFHNHAVIEPLLQVFDYGTPPFMRLLAQWRRQAIQEAAACDVDLVLTCVWGLELASDADEVRDYIDPYLKRGADIRFVELYADLDTRLARNRTELRLAEKRSKRDIAWSDRNVHSIEPHRLNTAEPSAEAAAGSTPGELLLAEHPHLRLDNTLLAPEAAARTILAWLGT